jgi:hypothetical protein
MEVKQLECQVGEFYEPDSQQCVSKSCDIRSWNGGWTILVMVYALVCTGMFVFVFSEMMGKSGVQLLEPNLVVVGVELAITVLATVGIFLVIVKLIRCGSKAQKKSVIILAFSFMAIGVFVVVAIFLWGF